MKKEIKITLGLLIGAIVFVILHNAIFAIFGVEEPVFLILVLLSGVGLVIRLLIQIVQKIIKKIK